MCLLRVKERDDSSTGFSTKRCTFNFGRGDDGDKENPLAPINVMRILLKTLYDAVYTVTYIRLCYYSRSIL